MTRSPRALKATLAAALTAALTTLPTRADIPLRAQRVASGLPQPLFVTAPANDNDRLFIVSKSDGGTTPSNASIRILNPNTNALSPTPFLTLSGLYTQSESGLLGLAFHPEWGQTGSPNKDYLYVNVTVPGGAFGVSQSQVRRYTSSATNPNAADPASMQIVLTYDQPQANHNGGWMGFSPKDNYLYVATGDGGNFNDTGEGHTGNGQSNALGNSLDTSKLLGKMLRVDVNGDDFTADANRNYAIPRGGAGKPPKNPFAPAVGAPTNPAGADEIWAYGLRNPWRNSFDRKTGDLWIGDVGQDVLEEIDFQRADSAGGENYGWRAKEATRPTGLTPVPAGVTDPIHEYGRSLGNSVTGGYVYRGSENGTLEGTYLFADYGSSRIFSLRYNPDTKTVYDYRELKNSVAGGPRIPTDVGTIDAIASLGEDAQGRLYVVDIGGEIFRLVPPILGDTNLDRTVNNADFRILYANFAPGVTGKTWAQGDFNDDHIVNFTDFQILERYFGQTVPFGTLPEAAAVPEPTTAALALVALTGLGRQRRGRARLRPSRLSVARATSP
jgi:glucose/arabinose dehydrogenase